MEIPDPSPDRAAREVFVGLAQGGPLDGQTLTSRFPRGIVTVDKAMRLAWIYDFVGAVPDGGNAFQVRDSAGVTLDDEKRWAAAEGAGYDVVAVG